MDNSFLDLKGKNVIITGAAGGIGSAITRLLNSLGTNLLISDLVNDDLQRLVESLPDKDSTVISMDCDVSDRGQVENLFQKFDAEFEALDVLVNVPFSFPSRVRPHELALQDWEQTLNVCATGYFICSQMAIQRMIPRQKGCILNVGSIAGASALGRGNMPYSAAKAAVHQMTKELAVEYARDGIRVNAVLPAQVLTPGLETLLEDPRFAETIRQRTEAGIPLGRLLQPEEVAYPAVFLCTQAASAITGVLLPIDGGNLALNAGGSIEWPETDQKDQ